MAWTNAVAELRANLSDGPTDRMRWRKKTLGEPSGLEFKTFEFRRVTNFTTAVAPEGVYVNGSLLPASGISADYPEIGAFYLVDPVTAGGMLVEATYYIQFFLDSELDTFLTESAQWLNLGSDYTGIPDGLKPAARSYAMHLAFVKLANRWMERTAEQFRLEDSENPSNEGNTDSYSKLADMYLKEAIKKRNDFYERAGAQLEPNFGSITCGVPDAQPRG